MVAGPPGRNGAICRHLHAAFLVSGINSGSEHDGTPAELRGPLPPHEGTRVSAEGDARRGDWLKDGSGPREVWTRALGAGSMKIPPLAFTVTDWSQVEVTHHPGETGHATWRTLNIGDLRVRSVEYSAGYLADHWCDRGHVLYVVEGELQTELKDGRSFTLTSGMSYQVSDFGDAPHRSSTKTGAKLFIVD